MSAPFAGRLPVREHLRPKPQRKVYTEADIDPVILRAYPRVCEGLNAIIADVFAGPGKPGRGWDGWTHAEVPLDVAVSLPVGGEA